MMAFKPLWQAARLRLIDMAEEVGCSMVRGDWQLWVRKFRYWGVTCYCGEFKALREITSFAHEKRPDVDSFKFTCTHSERGADVKEKESHHDNLLIREFDHPIGGFTAHRDFMESRRSARSEGG
jgi:hypothetical protein